MGMNNVLEKAWKEIGGNEETVPSMEKFGGYKTEVKERIESREGLTLKKGGSGRAFREG